MSSEAMPPYDVNPTGVTTFDHHDLAGLPGYWAASRALHDLRAAVVEASVDMPWEEWLAVVHALVAAPFFADVCPRCLGSRVPPYAATVRGERLEGLYRCASCAHSWSCGWETWAPAVELGASELDAVPFDIPPAVDEPRGDAA